MLRAAIATVLLSISSSLSAATLPRIASVTFTQTAPGLYTATISGRHFGAAPTGIPCTACTPLQAQLVNQSYQPHQQAIDVAAWSDSSVTLNNIQAGPGDSVRIALYNAALAATAAWGGLTAPNANVPVIRSITSAGTGASRVLTITGSGFGPAPGLGSQIDTPYLVITDWDVAAPNSSGFPWNGGFCGRLDCNGVTANYTSWTDRQIVISGFGSAYGQNGWTVSPGDSLCVGVWPGNSPSNGTWGGRFACTRVAK